MSIGTQAAAMSEGRNPVEQVVHASDVDTESSCSVANNLAFKRAIEMLLQTGKSVAEVVAELSVDEQYVLDIQQAILPQREDEDTQDIVEKDLMAIPQEFVCSITGVLMNKPVVDVNGLCCEQAALVGKYSSMSNSLGYPTNLSFQPNKFYADQIAKFKKKHVYDILSKIPPLLVPSRCETAARLLQHVKPIAKTMPVVGDADAYAEALIFLVQIPKERPSNLPELVTCLAERGRFEVLCNRFDDLELQTLWEQLTCEQVRMLFVELGKSVANSCVHQKAFMSIGRGLSCKLASEEATLGLDAAVVKEEEQSDTRPQAPQATHTLAKAICVRTYRTVAKAGLVAERWNVLSDLYGVDSADDLREHMANMIVYSVSSHAIAAILQMVPGEVLASAAALVAQARDVPAPRAVLLAAAPLVNSSDKKCFYRCALTADPECVAARKCLINLLMSDVEMGSDVSAKSELSMLLVTYGMIDALAAKFTILRDALNLTSMELLALKHLSTALAALGNVTSAAEVCVTTAGKLDAEGFQDAAMQEMIRAFEWDPDNQLAGAGLTRLGRILDREWEVGTRLALSATAQLSPRASSRLTSSLQMFAEHMDKRLEMLAQDVNRKVELERASWETANKVLKHQLARCMDKEEILRKAHQEIKEDSELSTTFSRMPTAMQKALSQDVKEQGTNKVFEGKDGPTSFFIWCMQLSSDQVQKQHKLPCSDCFSIPKVGKFDLNVHKTSENPMRFIVQPWMTSLVSSCAMEYSVFLGLETSDGFFVTEGPLTSVRFQEPEKHCCFLNPSRLSLKAPATFRHLFSGMKVYSVTQMTARAG